MFDRPGTLCRRTDQEHRMPVTFAADQVGVLPRGKPVADIPVTAVNMLEIQARPECLEPLVFVQETERLETTEHLRCSGIAGHAEPNPP